MSALGSMQVSSEAHKLMLYPLVNVAWLAMPHADAIRDPLVRPCVNDCASGGARVAGNALCVLC